MKEKIINMIDSVGIFETAKYFGGVKGLIELSKKQSGLYNLVMSHLGGAWTIESNSRLYKDIIFNFTILDFDELDEDIVEFLVDLHVDFSNLNQEERNTFMLWIVLEATEFEGFVEPNDETLNNYYNKGLSIRYINGNKVPEWVGQEVTMGDPETLPSPIKGFELYWSK
jgi:hypothetical protein